MCESEEKLKESLMNHSPILFVGAGFSYGAVCKGKSLPLGEDLQKELFDYFYSNSNMSNEDKAALKKCLYRSFVTLLKEKAKTANLRNI